MGRTYFKGITIGVDIPLGGEEGQFLVKRSDKDDDYTWGSVSGDISPTSDAPVSSKAVAEALETKVDKEEGKGLSTEDFTSEEKEKLDDIDLSDYVPASSIGAADGVASLDGNGRVPYSQLPVSAMEFKGTWNASTNTPTLTSGVGDSGDFYIVSVGGTWNGITFNANDRIIFDGVTAHDWVKLVAGEVNSVNGMSGDVVLPYPAPLFNPLSDYEVGDYVTYNGATYRFTADKTAGDWDSTKVTSVYIAGQYVTAGKKANTTLGEYATAEGHDTKASGDYSHAEGSYTDASGLGSHAEGGRASGTIYPSWQDHTTAIGEVSHAEGEVTYARGKASHSEGSFTQAGGSYSHAEGNNTRASGSCSHAEGNGTQTGADYQHVQGFYNVGKSTTLFEIGNGTSSSARSNAFEVDTSGNVVAGGTITDGQGRVLGSGGHVIKDGTGTSVTQRENLQFVGLNVDDDGTNTVVSDPVFTGTTAEWTAVTDKSKYKIVNLTDDGETGEVVDAITDGDMRPVTSNAVYDKLAQKDSVTETTFTYVSNNYVDQSSLARCNLRRLGKQMAILHLNLYVSSMPNNVTDIKIGTMPSVTLGTWSLQNVASQSGKGTIIVQFGASADSRGVFISNASGAVAEGFYRADIPVFLL